MLFILAIFIGTSHAQQSAIKHGEQLFLNYCSGCHSLNYTKYPIVSMRQKDAKNWFGIVPPNLTLVAKFRGKKWVVDYLHGFYYDSKRPFRCNNTLIPNVQMPNVLYSLQDTENYSKDIEDIVVFLDFIADPYREERYKIGVFVELFLGVMILIFLGFRYFY